MHFAYVNYMLKKYMRKAYSAFDETDELYCMFKINNRNPRVLS